jgi:hypothetical protein
VSDLVCCIAFVHKHHLAQDRASVLKSNMADDVKRCGDWRALLARFKHVGQPCLPTGLMEDVALGRRHRVSVHGNGYVTVSLH